MGNYFLDIKYLSFYLSFFHIPLDKLRITPFCSFHIENQSGKMPPVFPIEFVEISSFDKITPFWFEMRLMDSSGTVEGLSGNHNIIT